MIRLLLPVLFFFTMAASFGAAVPAHPVHHEPATGITPAGAMARFSTLKMKDVEKLVGRRLTLKEKIAVKLYQWKLRKKGKTHTGKPNSDKGKTAMIFGIAGLVLLFTPVPFLGGLAAITSIVLALVLGYQARKANPDDRRAKTAIILGWIGAGLIIVAIIALIVILSNWSWGWG